MNRGVFIQWLGEVNKQMRSGNRKILLFVDNAACHNTTETFSNLKLHYIPPNCTSVLQPCDQGVIRSFKATYRRMLLQHTVDAITDKFEFVYKHDLDLLTCLHLVSSAWKTVHPDTVINAFAKAGFVQSSSTINETNEMCNHLDNDISEEIDDIIYEHEHEVDVDSDYEQVNLFILNYFYYRCGIK